MVNKNGSESSGDRATTCFSSKINPKKVLDGILHQCYMARTPCWKVQKLVEKKPLDVESGGFFFIPSHRRMSVSGCPELLPFVPV